MFICLHKKNWYFLEKSNFNLFQYDKSLSSYVLIIIVVDVNPAILKSPIVSENDTC